MKEKYEVYEDLYEKLLDGRYDDEGLNVDERLMYIQLALDNICELLEKLVDCAKEEEKEGKKGKKKGGDVDAAEFSITKIGADIGEEKEQADIIARIFGNR